MTMTFKLLSERIDSLIIEIENTMEDYYERHDYFQDRDPTDVQRYYLDRLRNVRNILISLNAMI